MTKQETRDYIRAIALCNNCTIQQAKKLHTMLQEIPF